MRSSPCSERSPPRPPASGWARASCRSTRARRRWSRWATLEELSKGRALCGVGTGHRSLIGDGYGVPYRRPLTAVREFVEIVRRLLSEGSVQFSGEVFGVRDFHLEHRPARRTPIFVAALGPRMLQMAGEIGDGVLLNWATAERAAWAVERVRAAAARAGRDPQRLPVACFIRACVTHDPPQGRAILRRLIAVYAALPAYAQVLEESGFVQEVAAIRRGWQGGVDEAAGAVPEGMTQALGFVGPVDICAKGIEQFRRAGVDLPIIYPFALAAGDDQAMRTTIAALAGL